MEDKATQEWLDSLKKGTRHTYRYNWDNFLEFTGLTGDQILEDHKKKALAEDYSWENKIMAFRDWLINVKKMSTHTAKTAGGVVRGFFAFHRQDLKFRRSEGTRLGEAKTKTEDYRFSLEDLKKMFDVADLDEKYVLTAGKSFGLRAGDFLGITRGDLEPYLDRPIPISIGKYATQKESAPSYPFIDADALPVIKLMIEKMTRDGRGKPEDRILTFSHEIELTRVIRRLVFRAGIKVGNKRVRFHCMRKFLIDRLSSFMSESKWKQIVGKTISEGAYVSPDSLRSDYERAMRETVFSKLMDIVELQKRQQIVEELTSKLVSGTPFSEEDKRNIKAYNIRMYERKKSPKSKSNDCPDGEHCEKFEQIAETELLSRLKDGWQIIHRLTNGEVIVKR